MWLQLDRPEVVLVLNVLLPLLPNLDTLAVPSVTLAALQLAHAHPSVVLLEEYEEISTAHLSEFEASVEDLKALSTRSRPLVVPRIRVGFEATAVESQSYLLSEAFRIQADVHVGLACGRAYSKATDLADCALQTLPLFSGLAHVDWTALAEFSLSTTARVIGDPFLGLSVGVREGHLSGSFFTSLSLACPNLRVLALQSVPLSSETAWPKDIVGIALFRPPGARSA